MRFAHRVRAEETGVGLIELLIALTLIAVGVGAALSVFASSIVSLQHGAKQGTAVSLADRQLEAYRAMSFDCLPTSLTSGFTTPAQVGVDPACGTPFVPPDYTDPRDPTNPSPYPNPFAATQSVTGTVSPDHRAYTVTTSIAANSASCGGNATQIIVSVTLAGNATVLAREASCFSSAGDARSS
jgi:type II secretory pathway pseudopilin PulG